MAELKRSYLVEVHYADLGGRVMVLRSEFFEWLDDAVAWRDKTVKAKQNAGWPVSRANILHTEQPWNVPSSRRAAWADYDRRSLTDPTMADGRNGRPSGERPGDDHG